jgi:hypothetical protein
MKVVLVNPPRSHYDLSELSPPLGLLRLGTAAREMGADVVLVDFNLLFHLDGELQSSAFYHRAATILLEHDADVYGFTSMAVDSHVGLELARLIKLEKESAITVFGGPHFSSIASQLLNIYAWVDFVIKGEGEIPFKNLIRSLIKNTKNGAVELAGIHSRSSSPSSSAPSTTLREVPPLDYDLIDLQLYFQVNPQRTFNFEGGRGCRFKCTFCYSPTHYGRFRDFEIDAKLEELHRLKSKGVNHVFFVEDNFLNDVSSAITFCRALEAARFGLTWTCYATFPQLTKEVIPWMAGAGCSSVFTGIDAIGKTSQRTFQKTFLQHSAHLDYKLTQCADVGILPTCAFLISPPSHSCGADMEETLRMALKARNCGAEVRLNTLALYNGTRAKTEYSGLIHSDSLRTNLLFDVPDVVVKNDYAHAQPDLFPFHSRYVPKDEWKQFLYQAHCLFTVLYCYPKTLESLWEQGISPTEIVYDVLEKTDDLLSIRKQHRRTQESVAASSVFNALVKPAVASQRVEAETLLGVEHNGLLS